ERVTQPLRRLPDGGFEPIAWDVAITEIAARLTAIRTQHSPRAIGLVGIGGQGNHMDAPYGLGFLRALGSRRWFNAFAQEKTQHCLMDQWMFDASPATYFHADQRNARFLLVLGTNPRISNRGHNATESFKRFVEDPQHTLVVVDPRETETTRGAHRHLRVRPGTDAYLLLALAATIVRRGLVDETYVAEKTRDFAKLAGALAAVDVDEMAQRCGLGPAAIVETATRFAEAEPASGTSRCSRRRSCRRRSSSTVPSGSGGSSSRARTRISRIPTPRAGGRRASASTCSWSSSPP